MEATKNNQLVKVIEGSGLEDQTGIMIKDKFLPFFEKATEWKSKAKSLVVTNESETAKMKQAREARLALKAIRVEADKTRKELKADSIRYGKAVQGVYNVIEYLIAPIEEHLQKQEQFIQLQEANRKAELASNRKMELEPFSEFVPCNLDLANMSEEDFQKIYNGAKSQFQAAVEAKKQEEALRIEREKKEAEERERIRIENEKLRAQAEKRERELAEERAKMEAERLAAEEKARKEREEIEAKLKAEAEEKARLEAELRAKKEAEEKAIREEAERKAAELKAKKEAERRAMAAPDKEKLSELVKCINGIAIPVMATNEATEISLKAKEMLLKVSQFIESETKKI